MVKRSYAQFCPIARTMDLLGERWTLLIVRELLTGPRRYTDLKAALGGMGSNLLAERLRELEEAAFVHRVELPPPVARTVYELTARGRELEPVLAEIARFGLPYLDIPTDEQPMQPQHVRLALRSLVRTEELTDEAMTLAVELDEGSFTVAVAADGPAGARLAPGQRIAVSEGPEVHNGNRTTPSEADVTVRSSLPVLLWIRRDDLSCDDAEAQGLLEIRGPVEKVATTRRLLTKSDDQVDAERIASRVGS